MLSNKEFDIIPTVRHIKKKRNAISNDVSMDQAYIQQYLGYGSQTYLGEHIAKFSDNGHNEQSIQKPQYMKFLNSKVDL